MAGSRLALSCLAEGNPEPMITWSFRSAGGQSEVQAQGHQLVFPAAGLSQAGRYDCEARNTEGYQNTSVEVTVHGERGEAERHSEPPSTCWCLISSPVESLAVSYMLVSAISATKALQRLRLLLSSFVFSVFTCQ